MSGQPVRAALYDPTEDRLHLAAIGDLDQDYFMYWEDVDLGSQRVSHSNGVDPHDAGADHDRCPRCHRRMPSRNGSSAARTRLASAVTQARPVTVGRAGNRAVEIEFAGRRRMARWRRIDDDQVGIAFLFELLDLAEHQQVFETGGRRGDHLGSDPAPGPGGQDRRGDVDR